MADLVAGYPDANGAIYALLSQEGRDVRTSRVLMDTMPAEQGSRIAGSASEQLGRDLAVLSTSDSTDPAIVIGAPAAGGLTSTGATYTVRSTTLRGGTPEPATAGAAQVGTPPPVRNKRYTGRTVAYLWTDPVALKQWPEKGRRTLANNVEQTKTSPKNGFRNRARDYKHRKPIGGNIRRVLRPGKRLNNRERTPLYDSRLNLMGYLQQLTSGVQFRLYDANENLVSANPRDQRLSLRFEGTPCMDSGLGRTRPGDYVILAVRGTGFESPILGLRALIRRSDLPGGRDGRDFVSDERFPSAPNDKIIDSGWVSCARPAGFKNLRTPAVTTFAKQGFSQDDTYQGGDAAGKCSENETLDEREFEPNCGTSYINYEFPRKSVAFPSSVIGSASSTGIGGGGITRAVLSIPTDGLGVRMRDEIGYVDRNLPCTKAARPNGSSPVSRACTCGLPTATTLSPKPSAIPTCAARPRHHHPRNAPYDRPGFAAADRSDPAPGIMRRGRRDPDRATGR